MIYKLLKKTFGTNQILDFSKIDIKEEINDICYVDDLGIVFSTGNNLGLVDLDGSIVFPWKGEDGKKRNGTKPCFGLLSSISYCSKNKTIYICEDGGRNIRSIDVINDYADSFFKKKDGDVVRSLLKKQPYCEPAFVSAISKQKIYMLLQSVSKGFYFKNDIEIHVVGDGKVRYTKAGDAVSSSIGVPSGIATKGEALYISDSLNNVVRCVKDGDIDLCCGHPQKDILNCPSKIVIQKNILYIMCKDSVMVYNIGRNICSKIPVYESNRIANITADSDSFLYILEGENAKS